MPSFIVEFWSRIFGFAERLSLFSVVQFFHPRPSARFVDGWVLGHLVLALACLLSVSSLSLPRVAGFAIAAYGLARVFEIAVYQTNVLLFAEYRATANGQQYALHGYRRIVLLLLHNYVEVILWFGCTYTVLALDFSHKWQAGAGTALGAIYSSFITMTTFGDFDLLPKSNLAASVLLFHTTVGLFMTLLSLARFISLIPAPNTKDPVELKQRALNESAATPQLVQRKKKKR